MNTCCTPNETKATSRAATKEIRRPRYHLENGPEADTLRIELPGVPKDAVNLHVEDRVLTLHAERRTDAPEGWRPLHRELSDADYELRLRLGERLDEERVSARLEDGVLTLTLPVKEAVKPREIAIH